jgi:alpha-aminoadipate carrier protein LysW
MSVATVSECPVCAGSVDVPADVMLGELLDCAGCGAELEVARLDGGVELTEAPMAGEDWGE